MVTSDQKGNMPGPTGTVSMGIWSLCSLRGHPRTRTRELCRLGTAHLCWWAGVRSVLAGLP